MSCYSETSDMLQSPCWRSGGVFRLKGLYLHPQWRNPAVHDNPSDPHYEHQAWTGTYAVEVPHNDLPYDTWIRSPVFVGYLCSYEFTPSGEARKVVQYEIEPEVTAWSTETGWRCRFYGNQIIPPARGFFYLKVAVTFSIRVPGSNPGDTVVVADGYVNTHPAIEVKPAPPKDRMPKPRPLLPRSAEAQQKDSNDHYGKDQ
ncbi:hypothetical protein QBC34DRAFT_429141 [Podospora aff. communis PSN243]|uniref:Uncharacterized protein n=1 Tax=Podospora aff. communis PSN243 TaxID=3040156 RepID=A0AAV9GB82_9PEZI|nr:hypothetical protein QBC34DRAFT_429141 [Podospora aff. communis PSN243]